MTEQKTQSWWHTVPGMLTGIAATITAVTGLVVAINQAGWLKREPEAKAPATSPSTTDGSSASKAQPTGAATLTPARTQVQLGDVTFTLLAIQNAERTAETRGLTISLRATNNGPYPVNFWNSNFRLLVDDVPQAPVGELNKVVEGRSAQTGDVEFTYPANSRSLALRIVMGDTSTEIPLAPAGGVQP